MELLIISTGIFVIIVTIYKLFLKHIIADGIERFKEGWNNAIEEEPIKINKE